MKRPCPIQYCNFVQEYALVSMHSHLPVSLCWKQLERHGGLIRSWVDWFVGALLLTQRWATPALHYWSCRIFGRRVGCHWGLQMLERHSPQPPQTQDRSCSPPLLWVHWEHAFVCLWATARGSVERRCLSHCTRTRLRQHCGSSCVLASWTAPHLLCPTHQSAIVRRTNMRVWLTGRCCHCMPQWPRLGTHVHRTII